MQTLMLTPWMAPHKIISWQRAVVLMYLGKVEVIETWADELRGPSIAMLTPAVVRLKKGSVSTKQTVRFSRINVFTRDKFRCQYCGERKALRDLNYDHVIPRVQGGKTVWENIVTSCYACNDRKGSRTPEQARMTLLRQPKKPASLPVVPPIRLDEGDLPDVWQPYCDGFLTSAPLSA
jgi:5-methylcytosine-specific restriction endonuclease McrA